MANMKTDNSGIITTEFYTGRCPVRCELCFVNFGMNGSNVPYAIYSTNGLGQFGYANCQTTLARLRKDKKGGQFDWVVNALCGPAVESGENNKPRQWSPVIGVDAVTGDNVPFWAGMGSDDFERVLKPLIDDPGQYSIPKVPEAPWFRDVPATQGYNGQWLPSVLRVNSMSDSSVAPSEWLRRLYEIWGDSCFFNTNVHAIKRYPENMRQGLYPKVVVTANPGLQKVHAGLNRYLTHYPRKEDIVSDPGVVKIAKEIYQATWGRSSIQEFLLSLSLEELYGLVTLRLGAETMKGSSRNQPWHFFSPALISDIDSRFEQYEQNIKFYRVRALPTIQPHVDKFDGHPIVYTVLRFKTVAQACEFATKYDIEIQCQVKSDKDRVVCAYYGVPCTVVGEEAPSIILMRDNTNLNGSPKRGEWSELHYDSNFFRASKEQMNELQYVCDRASKSCKACGLCATLDGTAPNWSNPVYAELGIVPQEYAAQDRYLCDSGGHPVTTGGVQGKISLREYSLQPVPFAIGRTKKELDFFYGPGEMEFWDLRSSRQAKKDKERQAKRQQKRRKNPDYVVEVDTDIPDEVGEPTGLILAVLKSFTGPRRNPDGSEVLIDAMCSALRLAADYGSQGADGVDDWWWQGWDTHEQVATMVAYTYWWLMVLAHEQDLSADEAFSLAKQFSYDACEVDLFEPDFAELSAMYYNRSNWNDQFGPTY